MIKSYNRISLLLGIPGIVLQVAGFTLAIVAPSSLAGILFLAGMALPILGLSFYAKAKGLNPAWGLLGLLTMVGFIVLVCMKDKSNASQDGTMQDGISPPQMSPSTELGQDAMARLALPVGRSGYAIAAGYLALFSVVPFLGMVLAPLTIIFAIMAHKRIRANPQLHGMGRVIFAYILGGLALVFNLAIVVMMVVVHLEKQ